MARLFESGQLRAQQHRGAETSLADEFFESYLRWREACEDVRTSYRRWDESEPHLRGLGFVLYCAALEREEHAASLHSDSAERLAALAR
jgi:hypothetical protein